MAVILGTLQGRLSVVVDNKRMLALTLPLSVAVRGWVAVGGRCFRYIRTHTAAITHIPLYSFIVLYLPSID